jgi:hypothetical protein
MGKCSFAKVAVNDVFQAKYPFGTDLEGRFMYIEDVEHQWLLASFDFSGTFRRTCMEWREGISAATGIPVSNIWYHELQIHAAPISFELDGEPCKRLIQKCIPVIKDMISRAEDAELSYIIPEFDGRFNMNRDQYIPELGGVTVWSGLQFDNDGRAYSRNLNIMLLDGYKPDIPGLKDKVYFDRPADPQGALLVFRAKTGDILGTVTRFAGHPDVAVLFESRGVTGQYRYNFDWPGYLRQVIDSTVGGTGVYINGPCGNLSVKKGYDGMDTYEACAEEAERIGREIAGAFLTEWEEQNHTWEDVKIQGVVSSGVDLPMRETMSLGLDDPADRDRAIKEAEEVLKKAISDGEPPARIKRLIDRKFHLRSISTIINEWVGLSDQELRNRLVRVEIEAVSLNGLVISGVPGECLTETCMWLRAQSLGNKLIMADQVNGYMGYMVTPETYDHGGYAFWGSWLRRDAEPIMKRKALSIIKSLTV